MSRDPFESRRGRADPLWVTTPTDSWATVMPGQRHPSEQADLRAAAEDWIRRYREEGISRGIYRATPDGVEFVADEMVDGPRPPRRRPAPPGSPAPISPVPFPPEPVSPVPVAMPAGGAYGRGAGRVAAANESARGRPDRADDHWDRDERGYGDRSAPPREQFARGATDRDLGRRRSGPPPEDRRDPLVRDLPSWDRRPRTPDRREMFPGDLGPGPGRGRGRELESGRPGRRDSDPRDQRGVEAYRDPYDEPWPARERRDRDRRDGVPRDATDDRRRAVEPRGRDPRRADRRGLEPTSGAGRRDLDPRDVSPRDLDRRGPGGRDRNRGPREYDPRAIEPRPAQPRATNPRDVDSRDMGRRGAGQRPVDPREPRAGEPRRDEFGRIEYPRESDGRGDAPRGDTPRHSGPGGNGVPRNGTGPSRNGHDSVPPMVAWDRGGGATGRARPVPPSSPPGRSGPQAGPYPPTYAAPDRRPIGPGPREAEPDPRPAGPDQRPTGQEPPAAEVERLPVAPPPPTEPTPGLGYGALLAEAGLAASAPLDVAPLDADRDGARPERDMFAPARPVSPAARLDATATRPVSPATDPVRPDDAVEQRSLGRTDADDAGWFDATEAAGSGTAAPTSATPSTAPTSPVAPGGSGGPAGSTATPAEPAEQAPPGPPDPERQLALHNWRYHFDTLRELVEEPDELRDIRERLTEKLDRVNDNASRARLLSLRAVVSRLLNDLDKALADGKLALVHAEATGELRRISIAQARLAHVHQWRGEYAEADRLYELANSSELPDRLRATMHEQAARCAYDQSRFMEACNHLDKALELRKVDDPDLIHRIEMALDAIFAKVLLNGWGPYPRTREEILRIRRAPTPAYDERSKLWGYVGPGGEPAIAPTYAEVQPFSEGLAWVRRPQFRGWELIDDSGRALIDASARYVAVASFSDGVAWVVREGTRAWIGIDRGNKIVIGDGFEDVRAFRRGLAAVRRGAWGAIDKGGLTVVPMRYSGIATALADGRYIEGFSDEGLAVIDTGTGKGVVDRTGRVLVEPRYPAIVIHPVAFLIAEPTGQWGALDRRGRELIDLTHPSRGSVIDEIDRLLADTRPVL